MDLGLDLARADARALGEDQDVLAALQRMLGGAQALHVGGATLHGNAAHAAKGPAYDLALGELGLKDGADAAPAKEQRRLHGQELGHRGVVADDHAAASVLALKQQVSVLDLPAPHELGEGPQDGHDHDDGAADERRELGIGGVVIILGRLLKQAHGLPPLVDEVLDNADDLVDGMGGGVNVHGVLGGHERRDLAAAVKLVALLKGVESLVDLGLELLGSKRLGVVLVTLQHAAAARSRGSAVRKTLTCALGNTTVPMSRPSATISRSSAARR